MQMGRKSEMKLRSPSISFKHSTWIANGALFGTYALKPSRESSARRLSIDVWSRPCDQIDAGFLCSIDDIGDYHLGGKDGDRCCDEIDAWPESDGDLSAGLSHSGTLCLRLWSRR